MKLQDKAIIVTGSTMGIGKAIAKRAIAEGARVLVHGLEQTEGESVCKELGQDRTALHIDDLADPLAAQRTVGAAIAAFGKLDVLVNNAGMVVTGRLEDCEVAAFDRVMAVNARAHNAPCASDPPRTPRRRPKRRTRRDCRPPGCRPPGCCRAPGCRLPPARRPAAARRAAGRRPRSCR